MSDNERPIDWGKTTFDGSRREQLRQARALSVRQRLEALDQLTELSERLQAMPKPTTATSAAARVREPKVGYRTQAAGCGLDTRIRLAVFNDMPDRFHIRTLQQHFPDTPRTRIKRILNQLREEGCLSTEGHGAGTRWYRNG